MVKKIKFKIATSDGADVVLAAIAKSMDLAEGPESCWWAEAHEALGEHLSRAFAEIGEEAAQIAGALSDIYDEADEASLDGPEEPEEPMDFDEPWEFSGELDRH